MPETKLQNVEMPVPYDVVYHTVAESGHEKANPFQPLIEQLRSNALNYLDDLKSREFGLVDKIHPVITAEDGSVVTSGGKTLVTVEEGSVITHNHLKEALKYLVPVEIKPGDSIAVKDGTITYEELKKVAERVDGVSVIDAPLKMPRIFVYPKFPSENTEEGVILNDLRDKGYVPYLFFVPNGNAILIPEAVSGIMSKGAAESALAHEFGHSASYNGGVIEFVYNQNKHAEILLGRETVDACRNYPINGFLNTPGNIANGLARIKNNIAGKENDDPCVTNIQNLSDEDIEKIGLKNENILKNIKEIDKINLGRARSQEVLADRYAILAEPSSSEESIRFLMKYGDPDSKVHPHPKDRKTDIEFGRNNPEDMKEILDNYIKGHKEILEVFKAYVSSPSHADNGRKTPAPPLTMELIERARNY